MNSGNKSATVPAPKKSFRDLGTSLPKKGDLIEDICKPGSLYEVMRTGDSVFKLRSFGSGIIVDVRKTAILREFGPFWSYTPKTLSFDELANKFLPPISPLEDASKKICTHEWKQYTGLIDQFDYCIHCDEKRVA